MFKSLPIPAKEWLAAKTPEEKAALSAKYQVPMTADEIAAIEERQRKDEVNQAEYAKVKAKQDTIAALEEIDRKSIRALREGNAERLATLEAEAETLRQQLNGV